MGGPLSRSLKPVQLADGADVRAERRLGQGGMRRKSDAVRPKNGCTPFQAGTNRKPPSRRAAAEFEQGGVEKDRRTDQERQHATPFLVTDIAGNPLTIDE